MALENALASQIGFRPRCAHFSVSLQQQRNPERSTALKAIAYTT
jgi:hypothetical protein